MTRDSLPRDRVEPKGIKPEQLERARRWAARFEKPQTNRAAWDAFHGAEDRADTDRSWAK